MKLLIENRREYLKEASKEKSMRIKVK